MSITKKETLPLEASMDFPASSEFISTIRLAMSGIATNCNLDIDEIEDIKIAISEACNNAIQHAYSTESINPRLKITINCDKKVFKISISDQGKGFDTSTIQSQNAQDNEKLGLGLGITFMKTLMDDVKLESTIDKGSTITISKKINAAH